MGRSFRFDPFHAQRPFVGVCGSPIHYGNNEDVLVFTLSEKEELEELIEHQPLHYGRAFAETAQRYHQHLLEHQRAAAQGTAEAQGTAGSARVAETGGQRPGAAVLPPRGAPLYAASGKSMAPAARSGVLRRVVPRLPGLARGLATSVRNTASFLVALGALVQVAFRERARARREASPRGRVASEGV